MAIRSKIALVTVCVAISASASCQVFPGNADDFETMPLVDEYADYESLVELVSTTHIVAIELNRTTADELRHLNVLTDAQIDSLLTWRRRHGPLLDIHELQVIPGFDIALIRQLLPYVSVVDPASQINSHLLKHITTAGDNHIVARYQRTLEKSKGFRHRNSDGFKGSPDALFLRMRSSLPGNFSIGFTGEKDAGEQMRFNLRGNQPGFDFTSFHLQVRNKGWLHNVIIGDFRCQFAQGLLLGGGHLMGRGDEISGLQKASVGFSPYTSVQESAYRRGLATTVKIDPRVQVSAFYSHAMRDAAGGDDSSAVTSIYSSGLHRTETERLSRKTLREQHTGTVLRFTTPSLDIGIIGTAMRFGTAVHRRETLYNQFAFRGRKSTSIGAFLNYRFQNISFFSEVGKSIGAGSGIIMGILCSAHEKLDISTLYRYYSPDLHSFTANALSENSMPQNEEALHWAWKYRWNRRCSLNGYVDLFRFPWLAFRRYAPSNGHEWSLRGSYRPSREANMFLQLRQEFKARNSQEVQNIYTLTNCIRRHLVLNVEYKAGRNIHLKSRIQFNHQEVNKTRTEGWAFVQDIRLDVGKFKVAGRHALFDTDHYDNRHYVYERDAWSAYSMPAYAGIGVRNYILIEYKASKKLTLWIRYARTRMQLVGEIGSGEDTIDGNTRNDVKLQARFTF